MAPAQFDVPTKGNIRQSDHLIERIQRFPQLGDLDWAVFRSSPLCDNCQLLVTPLGERRARPGLSLWVEWEPLSLLLESAQSGCTLCGFFQRALLQTCNPLLQRHLDIDISARYLSPETISLHWNEPSILLSLRTPLTHGSLSPAPDLISSPLAPSQAAFLAHHLATCRTSPIHKSCPPTPAPRGRQPARLLEITAPLITLVPYSESTAYTALSYSWGPPSLLSQHPPLTTTTKTLPTLQSGIPISSLPLTLRQAVEISSASLGISHIWIDSLCIIQDSVSDWETEAAKMGDVYQQASITIIAASSTSCHSGFLPVETGEFELGNMAVGGDGMEVQVRGRKASETGYHKGGYVSEDPVDRRGWTYQEELLSSRHVKFTGDDVQWRCGAGGDCLCGEAPVRTVITQWGNHWQYEVSRWALIILNFSRREFTVESDRMLALAGVARKVSEEIKRHEGVQDPGYIAGLWGFRLVGSLCWRTDGWHQAKRCAAKYIAPSWSWVSVFGLIDFPLYRDTDQLLVQVLSVEVERVGKDDVFGRVKQGKLVIRGLVFECVCVPGENGRPVVDGVDGPELKFPAFPAERWECEVAFDCLLATHTSKDGGRSTHRCVGADSCPLAKEKQNCHEVLPGTEKEQDGGSMRHEVPARMLVLGRFLNSYHSLLLGEIPGTDGYQRIGSVMMEPLAGYSPEEDDALDARETVVIY